MAPLSNLPTYLPMLTILRDTLAAFFMFAVCPYFLMIAAATIRG
jgi:hypothetical protein